MTVTVTCTTLFDITATGVRSHYRSSRIPFVDEVGNNINDVEAWHRSRNQQRNWETLNQIIFLRTSPVDVTVPQREKNQNNQLEWQFSFVLESPESIMINDDPIGALVEDTKSVPMILGLDETVQLEPLLMLGTNIWFSIKSTK